MAGLLKTGWNGLLRKSERGSEKVETGLEKEEGGVVEVPMDGEHENGNGNMVFAHFMVSFSGRRYLSPDSRVQFPNSKKAE